MPEEWKIFKLLGYPRQTPLDPDCLRQAVDKLAQGDEKSREEFERLLANCPLPESEKVRLTASA